jgi:hypothetical protein
MRKTIVISMVLLVALAGTGQAQTSDRAGSVGVLFLKLGMSPRAAALGGAYVGFSDDVSGIFLNPVAIINITGKQVFFSEMEYMVDTRALAGVFSFPLPKTVGGGRAAVHYTGFFSGDMTMTTATDVDGVETNRKFSWNELAMGVTYAREFTDRFSIGVGAKYVRTDVADYYAHTVAFDVGTMYRTGFRNLRLGMSTTNFGPDMKFRGMYDNTFVRGIWPSGVTEDYGYYALPISFQVGIADEIYTAERMRVTAGIDYSHPNDLAERVHIGAEFAYDEMFFVRGGFFADTDKSELVDPVTPDDPALDRFNELRFGAGVKYMNLAIDYAWQDLEDLESVHRIGVSYAF